MRVKQNATMQERTIKTYEYETFAARERYKTLKERNTHVCTLNHIHFSAIKLMKKKPLAYSQIQYGKE